MPRGKSSRMSSRPDSGSKEAFATSHGGAIPSAAPNNPSLSTTTPPVADSTSQRNDNHAPVRRRQPKPATHTKTARSPFSLLHAVLCGDLADTTRRSGQPIV